LDTHTQFIKFKSIEMQTRSNKLANKRRDTSVTVTNSSPEDEEMKEDEIIGVRVINEPMPNPLAKPLEQLNALEETKE
jgi:hypothetical protein